MQQYEAQPRRRILGLDTSSSFCGWAVVEGGAGQPPTLVDYGLIDWPTRETKKIKVPSHARRHLDLFGKVNSLILFHKIDVVAIEALHSMKNANTVRLLAGYIAAAGMASAMQLGSEPVAIAQNTAHARTGVKVMTPMEKRALGAGLSKAEASAKIRELNKARVAERVKTIFGVTDVRDDVSDAIIIALAGLVTK